MHNIREEMIIYERKQTLNYICPYTNFSKIWNMIGLILCIYIISNTKTRIQIIAWIEMQDIWYTLHYLKVPRYIFTCQLGHEIMANESIIWRHSRTSILELIFLLRVSRPTMQTCVSGCPIGRSTDRFLRGRQVVDRWQHTSHGGTTAWCRPDASSPERPNINKISRIFWDESRIGIQRQRYRIPRLAALSLHGVEACICSNDRKEI